MAEAFRGGRPAENRNMFSTGDAVYSYGYHYCIARRLQDGTILVSYRPYSPTTTRHCYIVRKVLLDWINVWDAAATEAENMERLVEKEREVEEKVRRARTLGGVWRSLLTEVRHNTERYIALTGVGANTYKRDFDY